MHILKGWERMKGFIRVGAVVPSLKICNTKYNVGEMVRLCGEIKDTQIVVFPELCITGYTCQDMFLNSDLINKAKQGLLDFCERTKDFESVFVVGVPLYSNGRLYNCAVVVARGAIWGVVPKTWLPNYNEYYEKRWFSSANDSIESEIEIDGKMYPFGNDLIFAINKDIKIGVEICEDLWAVSPPSDDLALCGANILLNLSASNELIGKNNYRKELVKMQSIKTLSAYVYASAGVNESTTDMVFGGSAFIYENGVLLKENQRYNFESSFITSEIDYEFLCSERSTNKTFSSIKASKSVREIALDIDLKEIEVEREYKRLPFVPSKEKMVERFEEISNIQAFGLCKRMKTSHSNKLVVGVSGGLDSTLALLVCERAVEIMGLPKENIIAISMRGFGTSNRTKNNAKILSKQIGATFQEISIVEACEKHFEDINLDDYSSLAFENAQARERTQILFDIANKENALVVGTGDLSELVLGWCTYNGDHISSYGVNSGVPKTLVKYLVCAYMQKTENKELKEVLADILETPISPELVSTNGEDIVQVTEDIVGSYELNDFIIYHFLRRKSGSAKIAYLMQKTFGITKEKASETLKAFYKRFFANQFKRSCLPDGVKIGTVSVSPRGDLRMSSDCDGFIWSEDL